MTRDTRLNLIFLTVFLVLSLPGAVILFRKKLDPKAPAMYLPKPVRPFMSAIDPRPAPTKIERVTGAVTLAWMSELGPRSSRSGNLDGTKEAFAVTSDEGRERSAAVSTSTGRVFQVLAPDSGADGGCEVTGVVWRSKLLPDEPESDASLVWEAAGQVFRPERVVWEDTKVPMTVIAEQKELGFILPPTAVVVFRAEFESVSQAALPGAGPPGLFKLTCENCGLRGPEEAEVPGVRPPEAEVPAEEPLD